MTVNLAGNLYDRLSADTGVPRHKVKSLLYRLAYDGETVTAPPGPEEFITRPGLQFAQRTLAIQELGDWLLRYSGVVAKEREEYQPAAALAIAREIIEGATEHNSAVKDRADLANQVASLREALSEIQDAVEDALRIGGA